MARNDLGIVIGQRENRVGRRNHASDLAAGSGIDEGIEAVEKSVSHVNDVGLLEANVNIRVCVRRSKVLERQRLAIAL